MGRRFKPHEGNLVKIERKKVMQIEALIITEKKFDFVDNDSYPKNYYSGWGVSIEKDKNGFYIPINNQIIGEYSNLRKKILRPIEKSEIDIEDFKLHLKNIKDYGRLYSEKIDKLNSSSLEY